MHEVNKCVCVCVCVCVHVFGCVCVGVCMIWCIDSLVQREHRDPRGLKSQTHWSSHDGKTKKKQNKKNKKEQHTMASFSSLLQFLSNKPCRANTFSTKNTQGGSLFVLLERGQGGVLVKISRGRGRRYKRETHTRAHTHTHTYTHTHTVQKKSLMAIGQYNKRREGKTKMTRRHRKKTSCPSYF